MRWTLKNDPHTASPFALTVRAVTSSVRDPFLTSWFLSSNLPIRAVGCSQTNDSCLQELPKSFPPKGKNQRDGCLLS